MKRPPKLPDLATVARDTLVDGPKARLADVMVSMLIEQRARVALLCEMIGVLPEEFFATPEVREKMVGYLRELSRADVPDNLRGLGR